MKARSKLPGKVVMLDCGTESIAYFEQKRHESLARMIAELKGYEFAGEYDPKCDGTAGLYFVPHQTLIGMDFAAKLGIHTADHLFGGVVPRWFLATKAPVHGLITSDANKPAGWEAGFTSSIADHLLPGYTAFSRQDAYDAGMRLLECGPIRLKDVFAAGGKGQTVARSAAELEAALAQLTTRLSSQWAAVIELNLEDITTYSIGQIYVEGLTVSYWGTQRVTVDNSGDLAYGGSDLNLVRGGFDEAGAIAPTVEAKRAVEAAKAFDCAAQAQYPEIFASRRNYDVGQGHDAHGVFLSGVLDQSWRIGGASGVEIAALRVFKDRRDLSFMRASAFNVYGADAVVPPEAIVHFHGVDDAFGPMLMYTLIAELR